MNTQYIFSQIDRFPFDLPVLRIVTKPAQSAVYSIFLQIYAIYENKQKQIKKKRKIERIEFVKKNYQETYSTRRKEFEKNWPEQEQKWKEHLKRIAPPGIPDDYTPPEYMRKFVKEIAFEKTCTTEERKIFFPKILSEEENDPKYKQEIKQKLKLEREENFRKEFERKYPGYRYGDVLYEVRIAFKVCCIFFCIYMAYPMI